MSQTLPVTGNTEQTRPENRAFYPALDGLRAIAFLMVFFQHYDGVPWGWSGVEVFFVLSGFLITGILFDSRDDVHRVRNFYVRRTLRIFPLYYGIMLLLVLLWPLLHWQWSWKWLVWPAYLGNYARFVHPAIPDRLGNFQPVGRFGGYPVKLFLGHFWSLCVEEQFYLFWPWIVFWIRDRRKLLWVCAATVPLCLLMRIVGQRVLPDWTVGSEILIRVTPFQLDSLLLGGLLALALRGAAAQSLLRFGRYLFPAAWTVFALCLVLIPTARIWSSHYVYPSWSSSWGLTLIDAMAALTILQAIQPGTFLYRALSIRPLRWMGRVSYGAYVLHDIPHVLIRDYVDIHLPAHPTRMTAVIALPATFLLAWLSFRFLETPFLNLKEHWTVR